MALLNLLQSTHFALTQNDVRFFLNGLLLELDAQTISVVATDGHRMAIARYSTSEQLPHQRLLIPRKGIQELLRLLGHIDDEMVSVTAGKNHFKFMSQHYTFTSGSSNLDFPAYAKVIPRAQDKHVVIDRDLLKELYLAL